MPFSGYRCDAGSSGAGELSRHRVLVFSIRMLDPDRIGPHWSQPSRFNCDAKRRWPLRLRRGALSGSFDVSPFSRAMNPRLTELLDFLDATRATVLAAASALPSERWTVRPAPDRWSVAEVFWHLQRVESGVAKLIRKRATEARALGHLAEDADGSQLGALDGRGVTDRTIRIQAPPQVSPTEVPSAEVARQLLIESRVMLRAAITDADGLALARITHPHPVLGEIDLYQWILFVGQHEERHVAQVAEAAAAASA